MTNHRVTAGPYTLELPDNGVAILYEADGAGVDHRLPGGAEYLGALVQFAGETIRLRAMIGQILGNLRGGDFRLSLGGEYRLEDGRVFWMDVVAVGEIMRRINHALGTPKENDLWVNGNSNPGTEVEK